MSTSQPFSTIPSSSRSAPVRVLAAVDFSEIAMLVVEEAAALAHAKRASQLHFVHVHASPLSAEASELRHAELLEWLEPRLRGLPGMAETRMIAHEMSGEPARMILELASDLSADAVVVGTRDRTGVQRLLLGSVASEVVQKCGCPVLVVRPKLHQQGLPVVEPACPACLEIRAKTHGEAFWCEEHAQRHGRRHTYYDPRSSSWSTQRLIS